MTPLRPYRALAAVLVLAALAQCLAGSVALAAPADREPTLEGPLVEQGEETCDRNVIRDLDKKVVADVRYCVWWFAFLPPAEGDLFRDHGALWMQVEVDPRRGWCTTEALLGLSSSPATTEIHSYTSREPLRSRSNAPRTIKLALDAEGAAFQPAAISQSVRLGRGRQDTSLDAENGQLWTLWRGESSRPVSFAMGFEMSWDAALSLAEIFEFQTRVEPTVTRCY